MPEPVATRASPASRRRAWRADATILAAAAVVVRLPAFVADAHLTYDDGVFGSSALLLRDGNLPYREIFSPQGPLFLPLVFVADLLGLRSDNGIRLLALASGAAVTVATYAVGRRITTRPGALLAGALVATSGSVLWTTAGMASDGPALALATSAVALAFAYRAAPSPARAAAVGAVLGAAMCVKVLVLPAAIPVGLLLLGRRRARDLGLAVAVAVAVGLAATLPWGFSRVWEQYIEYHRESARIASHYGAARKLVVTLVQRDPFVVAVCLLALATFGIRRLRGARAPVEGSSDGPPAPVAAGLLGVWAVAVAMVLVLEPAFWRPHVAHLIPPLALLGALRAPPARLLLVGAVVIAPWYVAHARPLLWPEDYDHDEARAVDALTRLPGDGLVITDEPGLAWRAGHRVPGRFVDASIKRIEQGQITTRALAEAAAKPEVCAVLVWDDRYGELHLGPPLVAEGYEVTERFGDRRVLYLKPGCDPG
jgi:Dolichyl-phosphate-mannose-protein mannosyltransferase